MKNIFAVTAIVALTYVPFHAEATLIDNGDGTITDTTSQLMWKRHIGGDGANGRVTWQTAKNWAENLSFAGYNDWRLPSTMPVNGTSINYNFSCNGTTDLGFNITSKNSELSYLYYVSLGGVGYVSPQCTYQKGFGAYNAQGPFQGLNSDDYWLAEEYAPDTHEYAWQFSTLFGEQSWNHKNNMSYAWAVRNITTNAVPEPGAFSLLFAGLCGVVWSRRNRSSLFFKSTSE